MKPLPALAVLITLVLPAWNGTAVPVSAGTCSLGLTLDLHPGLPPSTRRVPSQIARDIPRGPVTVSVPLYPNAQPLKQFVASAVPEAPISPYLQTGVAEFQTPASVDTVTTWYLRAFKSCGWRNQGSMTTNASVLTSGRTFVAVGNRNLTVEMTFGDTPSGGAYIAYAAEEITYPPRPARSYLHGPFSEVHVALSRAVIIRNGQPLSHVDHAVLLSRPIITRLVRDINAIKSYYTVPDLCIGGLSLTGPARLTFIRPNGSHVHAFETMPGPCGGLAVNHTRWLLDGGRVWNFIQRIVPRTRGK